LCNFFRFFGIQILFCEQSHDKADAMKKTLRHVEGIEMLDEEETGEA
jgi:hypothetical protein